VLNLAIHHGNLKASLKTHDIAMLLMPLMFGGLSKPSMLYDWDGWYLVG
jgi:hypothetical protein